MNRVQRRQQAKSPLVARWTRRWVRAYTASLETTRREARRAEIESDVWEHLADARAEGQRPVVTQLVMLSRLVVGIPADVVWCRRTFRASMADAEMKQRRRQAVAFVCAVVVFVDLLILSTFESSSRVDSIWWVLAMPIGPVLVGTIGVVATGLWIREQRRSTALGK